MKILYAIQGTGNGHISRARDIIPLLRTRCETDVLVSGYQADIELPYEVKYRLRGLSFIFGKKGGVDVWNTYIKANLKKLIQEINSLPIKEYDFVINDFEPVSAWACYLNKVPCIALSHQSALLDKNVPKPKKNDLFGKFILRNYAPSSVRFGLHFSKYSKDIFTPVIRKEVRGLKKEEKDHYTVYLPSYDDNKMIKLFKQVNEVRWQIFSKHSKKILIDQNVEIYPVTNEGFIQSMVSSTGVLCGAGFETPAEALYLGKKLMVIPMSNQYEQQCNAAALKSMGIPVLNKLKAKHLDKVSDWVASDFRIEINYPDITDKIVNTIFDQHIQNIIKKNKWDKNYMLTFPTRNKKERIDPKKTYKKISSKDKKK
ncbi:MAG: glycosyltransferase family protein [Bacteroidales bacterium]|jgi:uncharacterized protein (TIGR00661 family)